MKSNTIDESQDAGNFRRSKGKAVDTRVSAKWTDANIAALIEAEEGSGNMPFTEAEEGSGETEPDVLVSPVTNIASTPLECEDLARGTPQGKSSVNITKKKVKRLRSAESIAKSLDTISVNSRMRLEARTKRPSDGIAECMSSLHAHPGIMHGSQIWFFATELFADQIQRSLYMGIPTADLRLQWLEKKLAWHKITNPSLYTRFNPCH